MDEQSNEHLLKSRRLFIWGEINAESSLHIVSNLKYLSDKSNNPIYIYINSEGGETQHQDAILDEIYLHTSRGIEINVIGQGEICSAAAHILCLSPPGYRFMTEHSVVMLHPVSLSLSEDYAAQQEKVVALTKKKQEEYMRRLAKACGKTIKKFSQDIHKSLWLTSKEALRYGVIDDIWVGKFEKGIFLEEENE